MRRRIFLDTSYLLALVRSRDNRHGAAVAASQVYLGPFLTTDLVLIELANSMASPPARQTAVVIIERIRTDRLTQVISVTPALLEEALQLYKQRPDKAWGMVDCFSFVAMRTKGSTVALTFDDHFRQAGFSVPLLEE